MLSSKVLTVRYDLPSSSDFGMTMEIVFISMIAFETRSQSLHRSG